MTNAEARQGMRKVVSYPGSPDYRKFGYYLGLVSMGEDGGVEAFAAWEDINTGRIRATPINNVQFVDEFPSEAEG